MYFGGRPVRTLLASAGLRLNAVCSSSGRGRERELVNVYWLARYEECLGPGAGIGRGCPLDHHVMYTCL